MAIEKSKVAKVLDTLIRGIVSQQDQVSVIESRTSSGVTYSVRTAHKDYGRVVGAKAKNFKNFELMVKLMAAREEDAEAHLSVVPPESRTIPKDDKFKPNPKWSIPNIKPLLRDLCECLFGDGAIEVKDIDGIMLDCEIKVSNSILEKMEIIHRGERTQRYSEKDPETGDYREVCLDQKTVGERIASLIYAICKNNGRTANVTLTGINYGCPAPATR